MNNKYIIPFKYEMKGKYKNVIKGELSFCFSEKENAFYDPLFIVCKGTKFSKPHSLNVVTDNRLVKNSQLKNNFRELQKDVEIKEKITVALNTLFSQNTSYGSVIQTTNGIKILSGFLQALFQDKNSKKTRFISVVPTTKNKTNIILINEKDSLKDFKNLESLMEMKLKAIPYKVASPKIKEKYELKYTDNELKSVLISFLIGKSFREQEVVAGLETTKRRNGGGFLAKKIINDYWQLKDAEDKGYMLGYSRQWLSEQLNSDIQSPVNTLTKLIKNTEDNNIQEYIDNTFNGGEFTATSGYVSLPLISQFISKNNSMISKFKFGIGDIQNIDKKLKKYSTSIDFDLNDEKTWPHFSIINTFNESAKIIEDKKYSFFTTNDRFLHAKSYFYNEQLLIGSSNYTFSGSKSGNLELSIVTNNSNTKEQFVDWIKNIYENSTNIKNDILDALKQSSKISEPSTILWKVIDKLMPKSEYKSKSLEEYKETSEIYHKLFEYQKEAFSYIVNALEENGIFLLADEVGLGKTPIALAIMDFLNKTHGYNTAILAPKSIVENIWKPMTKNNDKVFDKTWVFDSVSISEFSQDDSKNISAKWFDQRKFIIIDESHFLRNTGNKRIEKYREYVGGAIENGAKILMLTATPIFNSFRDLSNQFNLGRKSTNMPRIVESFKNLDKSQEPIKDLMNDKILTNWLSERFLSRSKTYIKDNYKKDTNMKLPFLKAKNINAEKSELEDNIIDHIENLVSGKTAPIIKFMLAKRLEESIESFRKSFTNMVIKKDLKNLFEDYLKPKDEEKIVLFEDYIEDISDIDQIINNYEIDQNVADLIKKSVNNFEIEDSPKFQKLEEIINTDSNRGIAIFTTSIQTASALYSSILKKYPQLKVGLMTGQNLKTNSEVENLIKTEEDLATLFSPEKMTSGIVERILKENLGVIDDYKLDILIMSDKFAEGLNLQDNGTLVNFDSPWSPMIIQQRIGRLYRANAKYDYIQIYNLWPSARLEEKVKMFERSIKKHAKAITIQRLPDIFEQNYSERGYLFEKPSNFAEGNITNDTLMDLFALRNEKLIARANIKHGWYTVIEAKEDELFNLFEIENEFILTSGMEKIDTNSLKNLLKLKKLLSTNEQIDKTTHQVYTEENYYDEKYTNILKKHISEIKSQNKNTKNAKLVATIFISKEIEEL